MKYSIKNFFGKCHQIRSFLGIWSHLLKKYLMENFIFCAVDDDDISYDKEMDLHCKSIDWFLYYGKHWSLMG